MIVPRSKLLFATGVVIVPIALLIAVSPTQTPIYVLIAGVFASIVILDGATASRALAGLGIELPPIVRMSKDREGKFEVRIRNDQQKTRTLRIALGLPREIPADADELSIVLPAEAQWSRLVWTCAPAQRGNYRVKAAYVEGGSYAGLWSTRRVFPVQSEIRVYPNLQTERKNLAALFLNRGLFGLHVQRQIGKGRDFEKLREYVPGDNFDDIDWKATARRAKPITKVFQIERTQEIYVVVDASRLSARPDASNTPILERLVTAALVLGLAAEKQGDLFGLITFTDRIESFVRASAGKTHYSACRDALYTLQPRTVTPDFDDLSTFIRLRLRRRALLIFLTCLDDPALTESFVRNVELIRRQHLVMVNMIRPDGTALMFSDPNMTSTDDLYRKLGSHLRWQKLWQLGKTLRRRGVLFSLLENERFSADAVSQYLSVKQRQLL